MTESEALNMIQAKLTCMELYDLSCIEKGCDRKCENCEYNYAQGNNGEQKEALKVAIQTLEKQIPTAYDIDKVIEELEKAKTINVDVGFGTTYKTIRKDVAIEIVKQGVISDDEVPEESDENEN